MEVNIATIEKGLDDLAAKSLSAKAYGMELLPIFINSKSQLKTIQTSKQNKSDLEGGLIWRQRLHYAPAQPGKCDDVLDRLKTSKLTRKHKVRLLITSDGSTVLVYDVKFNEITSSTTKDIKNEPQVFLPLIGQERSREIRESPIDIKATAKLAKFYDALVEANPEWLSQRRHDLNHFMTQMIFCLFAEDTGIFPKDILSKTLIERAGPEGKCATDVISEIFTSLDIDDRSQYPEWLADFPYVNGGLFSGAAAIPSITPKAYRYLEECWKLDWKGVNPDILGSSIQAIVDEEMRGDLGLHYTSVPNILKVINPLFIDGLREQLWKARSSKKKIEEFLQRLSRIKVFDPACGSGNFLVIAYREMRKLELDAMDALRDLSGGASMAFGFNSVVSLNNFYGIEYADFAAETAKLALWIAEYQQNARFTAAFGESIPALPLKGAGNILCGNALRLDWDDFCPPDDSAETYIVGNPPYLGHSVMSSRQKDDLKQVFSGSKVNYKSLDYVTGWFWLAAEYIKGNNARSSFVATNSICQGSQVPVLWPSLFSLGVEIGFAHTSFKWSNNAANKAAVICVIIGLQDAEMFDKKTKTIISENDETQCQNINAYLLPSANFIVSASSKPLNALPPMLWGNKATDGGNLILTEDEKDKLLDESSESARFIKGFVGSQEFIKGLKRYVIWIEDSDDETARGIPAIHERIDKVRNFRANSKAAETRPAAEYPHRFRQIQGVANELSIVIPSVSSERREYLPCGVLTNGEIVSNLAFAIYDSDLWVVSLITSRLHLLWIKTVCGKLKTDFRYSNTLGWHTFPVPELTEEQKNALEQSARKIILTREEHLGATIADLYDPNKMPDGVSGLSG